MDFVVVSRNSRRFMVMDVLFCGATKHSGLLMAKRSKGSRFCDLLPVLWNQEDDL